MGKDWIERRNGALAQQANNFTAQIAANYVAYEISPADAALLSGDCASFLAAYRKASAPSTRTASAVLAQNAARQRLTSRMRDLGGRIRANQSISEQAKFDLSLTVPSQVDVAPDSRPTSRPDVYIRSLVGNILTVRLIDQESSRRGVRPRGVVGAQVFFATGDQPPGSFEGWHAPVVTLSSKAIIHLPYLPPGTKVWVTARWFNHRGETSVTSVPVSAHVGAMMIMPALAA